jgi:hypothetical protein
VKDELARPPNDQKGSLLVRKNFSSGSLDEKKCAVFVESEKGSATRTLLQEKMKRSSRCPY